uniref:Dopey N-terminal domain-containing protein n=1 Tax=Percolomonas cosmopolitus TaxID=63605 RepID=A0A7S1KMI6_9EUKA|mmetsp:Transcript_1750/g.6167  ORF Transcript_1750/g.6167 Transcript_1750/m.6167 type:complete len:1843 (+) Transcript_1750:374-5902(+)
MHALFSSNSANSQSLASLSDSDLQKKSRYKHFNDEITTILTSFEKSKDWTDVVKYLQKLHRVIQKYLGKCPVLPQSHALSKRLAQCLNPNMPHGVHKMTLDIYMCIFSKLKHAERLEKWSGVLLNGIFLFFPFAALGVKPKLFELFRDFLLTLDEEKLFPLLPGLITSLLSGLEEDSTSEVYRLSLCLLNDVRAKVGDDLFLKAFYESVYNAGNRRESGFKYLEAMFKMSQLDEDEVAQLLLQGKKRLALNTFIVCSHDPQNKAQRTVLDFLIAHYPIQNAHFTQDEKVAILTSLLPLLRMKDVSISRRVFSWMFGSGHFNKEVYQNTQEIHTHAFRRLFQKKYPDGLSAKKPLQILLYVLEKVPADDALDYVHHYLLDIMEFLHKHSEGTLFHQDVLINARDVFAIIKEENVWRELYDLVKRAERESSDETLRLLDMVGSVSNLLTEEVHKHTATLLEHLLGCLEVRLSQHTLSRNASQQSLDLQQVLDTNDESTPGASATPDDMDETSEHEVSMMRVLSTNLVLITSAFSKLQNPVMEQVTGVCDQMESIFALFAQHHVLPTKNQSGAVTDAFTIDLFKNLCSFIGVLLKKQMELDEHQETLTMPRFIEVLYECCFHSDVILAVHCMSLMLYYMQPDTVGLTENVKVHLCQGEDYASRMVRRLWALLVPQTEQAHFEVVRMLVQLNRLNPEACESLVSLAFHSHSLKLKISAHRKFSLMWRLMDDLGVKERMFDDGVLRMLESIKSDHTSLRLVGRSWLLQSCSNVARLLDPLFHKIVDQQKLLSMLASHGKGFVGGLTPSTSIFDQSRSRFIITLLQQIVDVYPQRFLSQCISTPCTVNVTENYGQYVKKSQFSDQTPHRSSAAVDIEISNYFSLLVLTCLRIMDSTTDESHTSAMDESEVEFTESLMRETLRTNSVILLRSLLLSAKDYSTTASVSASISEHVVIHLQKSVRDNDAVFQAELLGLLYVILFILNQASSQNFKITNLDSQESPVIHVVHSTHFLPTLLQGIQVANQAQTSESFHSYSLLTYWVDHIISFLPYLHTALPSVITAIVPSLCDIIKENAVAGIDSLRSQAILVSLRGLNKLLKYCVLNASSNSVASTPMSEQTPISARTSGAETVLAPFKLIPGMSNVTDFIKDVFVHEIQEEEAISPNSEARQFMFSELHSILLTMTIVWKSLRSSFSGPQSSLLMISHSTRHEIEKAIVRFVDPLAKKYDLNLMSSFIQVWHGLHPECDDDEQSLQVRSHELDVHVVDVLNNLNSVRPEDIVDSLVKVIVSTRLQRSVSKEKTALHFLNNYLRKCMVTDDSQGVLSKLVHLYRLLLSGNPDVYSLNILLRTLHRYLKRWPSVEDRRLRQALKDITQKLLESCLQACVREMVKQSANKNISSTANVAQYDSSVQLLRLLSSVTIDILLKVFDDREKIISLVQAMMQPLVLILKNCQIENIVRQKEAVILLNTFKSHNILHLRAVRKELLESFNDASFFKTSPETLELYKSIFSEIIKDSTFQDQFSKFQRQVSSIFLNRDSEALSRSRTIKRLSFLFFCGRKDEYASHLNPMMEKLVENLKPNSHPLVVSHCLFCLRVLLTRMSSGNFSEFWPIIVSALMQLLTSPATMTQPEVLLETIKLIDYAIVVQAEPFETFKWIFISTPGVLVPNTDFPEDKQFVPLIHKLGMSTTVFQHENFQADHQQKTCFHSAPRGLDEFALRAPVSDFGNDAEKIKRTVNNLVSAERYEYLCSSYDVDKKHLNDLLLHDFSELSSDDLEDLNHNVTAARRLYRSESTKSIGASEDGMEDSSQWILVKTGRHRSASSLEKREIGFDSILEKEHDVEAGGPSSL